MRNELKTEKPKIGMHQLYSQEATMDFTGAKKGVVIRHYYEHIEQSGRN